MHGADDANPGTTPLQAVKLYEAHPRQRRHRAPGDAAARAALVLGDGVATSSSPYEMLRWFDKYVKNAPPRKK